MSKEKIGKLTFGYWLLKQYAWFCHWLYYKRIYIRGSENIPKGCPFIFAPNHQNALMDPMAVLLTRKGHIVFLARADLFNKPTIAKILTFLKILPIYRIRDGYSSLHNNDAIFKRTVEVLKGNTPLMMLPEGNHEGFRRLRPFKKGLARIAFMAEEQSNFTMGIKIVPVGIDYSDYVKCKQKLLIQYGKPLSVSDYKEQYLANQPKAIQSLTDDLYVRIKELMIHIGDEENYETYRQTRDIYLNRFMLRTGEKNFEYPKQFDAEKKLVGIIDKASSDDPEFIVKLGKLTSAYHHIIKKYNLRSFLLRKPMFPFSGLILRSLALLILSPVFIVGAVFNYLPFMIPVWISRKVEDVQFHSSFKFVLALIVFPVYYLLLLIFPGLLFHGCILKIIGIAGVFITGNLALIYYAHLKKVLTKWRYNSLSQRGKLDELFSIRNEIFEILDRKTESI
jgi:1-acyl-sn-glycerol-3-phosphate acyltransferase